MLTEKISKKLLLLIASMRRPVSQWVNMCLWCLQRKAGSTSSEIVRAIWNGSRRWMCCQQLSEQRRYWIRGGTLLTWKLPKMVTLCRRLVPRFSVSLHPSAHCFRHLGGYPACWTRGLGVLLPRACVLVARPRKMMTWSETLGPLGRCLKTELLQKMSRRADVHAHRVWRSWQVRADGSTLYIIAADTAVALKVSLGVRVPPCLCLSSGDAVEHGESQWIMALVNPADYCHTLR